MHFARSAIVFAAARAKIETSKWKFCRDEKYLKPRDNTAHTSQIIHPNHLHHNWLPMQTPRRKCDLLMVIKGGGGTIHHQFQKSDWAATPLWCWFTAGVPTTTTKLHRAHSWHELSEVYVCAIVIRWPVYTCAFYVDLCIHAHSSSALCVASPQGPLWCAGL